MFCSPTSPGRPPHSPHMFPLHQWPPEPTSGGACRGARHVGLQLEEIRSSGGGGGGVFLALGMFWVSGYSSGPVVWMDGVGGDCPAQWCDLKSCVACSFHWNMLLPSVSVITVTLNAVFSAKGLDYIIPRLAFFARLVFPLWLIMCFLAFSYCFRGSLPVYKNIPRCLWRVWFLLTFIT